MANGCEFEFMEYVDEESIDPNLMCSICHKTFKDPVSTPCDHTYGRECITRWLTESEKQSCPVCIEGSLTKEKLSPASRVLRNMLDQLRVYCKLCAKTDLKRGNFIDHVNKDCPKAIVQCKAADIKCPWQGTRDESENHFKACIFEPLRPALHFLITKNHQLLDQVQHQAQQIKQLNETITQLQDVTSDVEVDSDVTSDSEVAVDGNNVKEEDSIYIRNLPPTVKFNDIFDLFSKIGGIKYNSNTRKTDIFVFKNQNQKDGPCSAKVVFNNKESAAAAVKEYNEKYIPQWNTRLKVSISHRKRRGFENTPRSHNAPYLLRQKPEQKPNLIENLEEPYKKDQMGSGCNTDASQSNPKENQAASIVHHKNRRRHPSQAGKPSK